MSSHKSYNLATYSKLLLMSDTPRKPESKNGSRDGEERINEGSNVNGSKLDSSIVHEDDFREEKKDEIGQFKLEVEKSDDQVDNREKDIKEEQKISREDLRPQNSKECIKQQRRDGDFEKNQKKIIEVESSNVPKAITNLISGLGRLCSKMDENNPKIFELAKTLKKRDFSPVKTLKNNEIEVKMIPEYSPPPNPRVQNTLRIEYYNSRSQKDLYRPLSRSKKNPITNRTSQESHMVVASMIEESKRTELLRNSVNARYQISRDHSHDLGQKRPSIPNNANVFAQHHTPFTSNKPKWNTPNTITLNTSSLNNTMTNPLSTPLVVTPTLAARPNTIQFTPQ